MRRALLILATITVIAVAYAVYLRMEAVTLRDAKRRLDGFCQRTQWGIRADRRDFESGDRQRQDAATWRFLTGAVTYHDSASVLTCLETMPTYELACFIGDDMRCRAELARRIELALRQRYPE